MEHLIPTYLLGLETEEVWETGGQMSLEEVILRKEGKMAYLLIHRERALNALNLNGMTRLDQIFCELESDKEILVLIITGRAQRPLWPERISMR